MNRMLTCACGAAQKLLRGSAAAHSGSDLGLQLPVDEVDVPVLSSDCIQCGTLRDLFRHDADHPQGQRGKRTNRATDLPMSG